MKLPYFHDREMTLPKRLAFSGERPTQVRHKVLAWICSLSVITYFDRVCISGAAPFISAELGLTPVQMGTVFSAFAISYALFEVPTGWLGDRIGARKVITRIVVWWSTFTALTGVAHRFWTMVTLRFIFGIGEAGMYPNSAKVFSCVGCPRPSGDLPPASCGCLGAWVAL